MNIEQILKELISQKISVKIHTSYSKRNSCSIRLNRRSSQESSKAVRRGSLEDKAIKDGEVRARYAFIRAWECLRESCSLDVTHSSHPHLENRKCIYKKKMDKYFSKYYIIFREIFNKFCFKNL